MTRDEFRKTWYGPSDKVGIVTPTHKDAMLVADLLATFEPDTTFGYNECRYIDAMSYEDYGENTVLCRDMPYNPRNIYLYCDTEFAEQYGYELIPMSVVYELLGVNTMSDGHLVELMNGVLYIVSGNDIIDANGNYIPLCSYDGYDNQCPGLSIKKHYGCAEKSNSIFSVAGRAVLYDRDCK